MTFAVYLDPSGRRGGTKHLISMEGGFLTTQNETHLCAEIFQLQAGCIANMEPRQGDFMNIAFVWRADSMELRAFMNGIRVALLSDQVRYSTGYTPRLGLLHFGEMVTDYNELYMRTFDQLKMRDFAIWKRALDDSEIYKCLGISRMTLRIFIWRGTMVCNT